MPIQITILGMGQIGGSIGLGLASRQETIRRVGHDLHLEIARQAEKIGAVDEVRINLPSSIEKADVVILALPFDQVEETLHLIAPDLKPDSIILDTSPVKQALLSRVKAIIPDHSHYLGFVPALSPLCLLSSDAGIGGARVDLFQRGVFAIVHNAGIPSAAIQLAADLAGILGAEILYADPAEIDSLMAALHLLPQMTAGALANMTIDQPGWREGQKLASRPYSWAVQNIAMLESPAALAQAAVHNRPNTLRVLDDMIGQLNRLRSLIEKDDTPALTAYWQSAANAQQSWWKERTAGSWSDNEQTPPITLPSASSWFSSWFGFKPRQKNK